MTMSFDDVAQLIRARRTSLFMDAERPIPAELVNQLCELASWAPCHKRTWPWRFAVVSGDARGRLGAVASTAITDAGADERKVEKTRTKYLRASTVLIVGAVDGDTEVQTAENRHAVAAAVQNLLLAATAAGLATYWSSCPAGAERAVAGFACFDPATTVIGVVYIGWPTRPSPAPLRPSVSVIHVD